MTEKIKSIQSKVITNELGEFYIDYIFKNQMNLNSLSEFLFNSISEIIKEIYTLMEGKITTPLIYYEEEFHTVFLPALVRLGKGFTIKSPIRVEWHQLDEETKLKIDKNWPDYRCFYKGHNYCIEVSKNSVSYERKHVSDKVKKSWNTSCEKLKRIRNIMKVNERKDITNITLQVLSIYVSGSEEEDLKYDLNGLQGIKNKVLYEISKKYPVNFVCMWVLDKKLVESHEYIHGLEKYPAVLFLGRVE